VVGQRGPVSSQALAVGLLRLAATVAALLAVAFVLATFVSGAQFEDENEGIETLRSAVFFFGPIAAILTLAFIVILALTRPVSMRMPNRRAAARTVAVVYAIGGLLAALGLRQVEWGWFFALLITVLAGASFVLLRRDETNRRGGGLPPVVP
jgi:uncharacterized membrane protein